MAVDELATDDDAATDTRAEGDDDEVLHATCCAVGHLADGCGVGVVGQRYGDAEAILDHLRQGEDALPGEVGGELDGASEVVAIGGTDADPTDLVLAADLLDEHVEACGEVVEVELDVIVRRSLDGGTDDDVAARIDDTEDGIRPADVDA